MTKQNKKNKNFFDVYDLKLLSGLPIQFDGINISPLKLIEIAEMENSEDDYNKSLSSLCFDLEHLDIPYKEVLDLKERNIDTYDVIINNCISDEDYLITIIKSISLFCRDYNVGFLGEEGFFLCDSVTETEMDDLKNAKFINKQNFSNFKEVIKFQNFIYKDKEDEQEPIFGNEKAKEIYYKVRDNERKANKLKKSKVDLYSLISSVAWKSGIGMDVWKLTIYQLYDAYYSLMIIDNCESLRSGISAGNVDGKKIKDNELNWAKKRDF